uniref:Uncharacterized protein n=1 Tax=Ascaris lumbricoides TaxID=6252 RepID=A0A0M3HL92_ASCLU
MDIIRVPSRLLILSLSDNAIYRLNYDVQLLTLALFTLRYFRYFNL